MSWHAFRISHIDCVIWSENWQSNYLSCWPALAFHKVWIINLSDESMVLLNEWLEQRISWHIDKASETNIHVKLFDVVFSSGRILANTVHKLLESLDHYHCCSLTVKVFGEFLFDAVLESKHRLLIQYFVNKCIHISVFCVNLFKHLVLLVNFFSQVEQFVKDWAAPGLELLVKPQADFPWLIRLEIFDVGVSITHNHDQINNLGILRILHRLNNWNDHAVDNLSSKLLFQRNDNISVFRCVINNNRLPWLNDLWKYFIRLKFQNDILSVSLRHQ